MNACQHCGREYNSSRPRCENCPTSIVSQKQENTVQYEVIEPEVVGGSSGGYYEQSQSQWSGATFKSWTFNQQGTGFGTTSNASCLPSLITFAIFLSIGIQYGLLASIGFLVFYALGSGINFFASMRRMVEGKAVSPWIGRVVVWIVSVFITISLAS